jgi:hypothetical protein
MRQHTVLSVRFWNNPVKYLVWSFFSSHKEEDDIRVITERVEIHSEGLTDGASVVIRWDELERLKFIEMETNQKDSPTLLMLVGNKKSVFVSETAKGWDALLERLEQLPGAQF